MRRACLLAILAAAGAGAETVTLKPVADTYVHATPFNSQRPEDSEAFQNHGAQGYAAVLREPQPVAALHHGALHHQRRGAVGGTLGELFLCAHAGPAVGLRRLRIQRCHLRPRRQPLPEFVYALATGDQFGWALSDEKGQIWARYSPSSREQSQRQPVLTVEGEREDRTAPGPVRLLPQVESKAVGRVALRFGGAGDDNGKGVAARYELRYSPAPIDARNFESATPVPRWMLDPTVPKPHPLATRNSLRDEVLAVVEQLQPGVSGARVREKFHKAGVAFYA